MIFSLGFESVLRRLAQEVVIPYMILTLDVGIGKYRKAVAAEWALEWHGGLGWSFSIGRMNGGADLRDRPE
jgi:hypothetical protein